jgi:hypothetical protein
MDALFSKLRAWRDQYRDLHRAFAVSSVTPGITTITLTWKGPGGKMYSVEMSVSEREAAHARFDLWGWAFESLMEKIKLSTRSV